MRTSTDIANAALDYLDADPIGSLTNDQLPVAALCRRHYNDAILTVLREHPWSCAITRMRLVKAELPDDFVSDYQTAYNMPADYIRALDINGRPTADIHHAIETVATTDGNGDIVHDTYLFCDYEGDVVLRYVRLIDANQMEPHLATAVALELAMRMCMKMTNSDSKMELLRKIYADTTRGSMARIGGYQISAAENRHKKPVSRLSLSDRARMGYL